ncbi:cell wall hydrolase SleB [Thermaerobacter marianensis DSM 12885]|uniref:Cell wall hydrolase SleB n=1 Tax=Thermaerobacter marianensis (strain ATCC 700841 / DSM 12885 / JCM 10246 / 7p75a) TaxID=644966 RepID=E6SGK0_THEM7|nr:cell wall hydrolase [Thermaerobacter marianensis]ADU50546.1 cell wall hydrolase SleB [Thermaerobacter marianensis DSM 12885]
MAKRRWQRMLAGLTVGLAMAALAVMGSTARAAAAQGGPAFVTHYVQRGETVWQIARRYGVPMADIVALNRLPSASVVWAGTYLAIPSVDRYDIYTVRYGDTLYTIARAYGLTAAALKEANALATDLLLPGQRLIVPLGGGTAGSAAGSSAPAPAPSPAPASSRGVTGGAGVQVSDYELRLLAQMVQAEAGGEPYVGKVAVAAVILNRVKSPLFPDTVAGVLFEPYQFEPVLNGTFWQEPSAEAWQAAIDAVNGWDPTGGALYFWNPAKSGYQPFLETRPSAGWIGNHRFAY